MATQSGSPIVAYQDAGKRYGDGENEVTAIENISLEVRKKEFVSIVGPSGCGKTTMLHLTGGLLPISEGVIEVQGINVESQNFKKHNVGLVFQTPVLLEWRTVKKNILLPIEIMAKNGVLNEDVSAYHERADELLELVGLSGFADSYPQELSGGMQQRVSICRSLIYDPLLLLMDEPFGALDALTRNKLNKELLKIWQGTNKTILFVTHNLEEAIFLSDRVVVLSERPATIETVLNVGLDRPRNEETRKSDRYHDLVSEAYSYFED